MKALLSKGMQEAGARPRVLLATEAYSMGADPMDVEQIVHIRPPNSVESKSDVNMTWYKLSVTSPQFNRQQLQQRTMLFDVQNSVAFSSEICTIQNIFV